jgi:hypothetical protein
MEPEAHFLEVNAISVDTGTGYNDSILVDGSYEGNASEVRIRLLNSEGNVTNIYNGDISLGDIPGIYLQPTKSGNYSLEIGIYGDDGFLEDHYINDNLFVDLHLPDLAAGTPEIMIEGDDGGLYQVQNIQTDDSFLIQGSVYNLGTVKANNVTVLVNDSTFTLGFWTFNFPEIGPNQEKVWSVSKDGILHAGEYMIEVTVTSDDEFEIDENNNQTSLSFFILDKQAHEYNVNTKNKNLLEINANQEGEYEFPWLEIYVTVANDKVQSWDFMTITAEIPDNWEFEAESFLQLSAETEVLVKVRPPLHTEMGEYKIELNLTDRNGFAAGNGEITVNVPQYYGVSIYAEQVGQEVKISITNSGNGKDHFKLTKDLEEGLTLYLTETYFEIDAFSSTTITALGMKTNTSKNYDAKFTIQSIGNENITAEVILGVTYLENRNQVSNGVVSTFLATIGMIGIIYFIYQRRIQ